ncbi:MAG: hypothetical protein ACKVOW_01135 [Chitinophagaceae bacterium]
MKAKLLIVIAVLGICISSCQKEISFDGNGGPVTGTSGDLLTKIVAVSGTETNTTEYEYDSEKRLIREKITGTSQGTDIGNDLRVIRNASGIITATVQKNQGSITQGIDSVLSIVYYNSSTNKYTAVVSEISVGGFSVADSSSFVYGTDGKILRQDNYLVSQFLGPSPVLSLVTDFSYGAAGIIEMRQSASDFQNPGAPPIPTTIAKYSYDTKVSPLIIPNGEAAVILRIDFSATSNLSNYEFTDIANGGPSSFKLSAVYTYNSKNKPISGVSTQIPGNKKTTFTYFYK